jgi:hypothetical protein
MGNSKFVIILGGPPQHRYDKLRFLLRKLNNTGLTGLLLFFLLIISTTPVSASESPSRLLDTAPFAFSKSSPTDDQINQATNLTLTWAISKFTDEYFYCLDSNINSTCDDSWHTTGLNTYQDLASLAYNTTYEWQVYAFNDLGTTYANTGTWWQFTTAESAPGAFGKTSPSDDTTSQEISLTLSWNSSSGADSYEYCYDSTLNNNCTGSWTSAGASTSADISSLTYGTQYEWQVRATNTNPVTTYADGGEWWHFTTSIPPPDAFSKSSPSSGAISQLINLTLSWGASSNATSYEYCYDSNLEIDHVGVCDSSWTSNVLTYENIEDLDYETQYEWQVRAINSSGTTYANTGTWWTFTTKANPTGLYKISPGDLTSNHPVSLALEWSSYGGTTSYEYCVDPTSSGTLSLCDSGWTNNAMNTLVTVDLAYGTEYEWQIRANDSEVTYADTGDWWNFTTVEAKPGAFFKSTPEDGAIGQLLSLTLEWTASTGATSYRYCIDDILDTICTSSWESVTTNSADITGLSFNTIYEWQVRAYNNNPSYTSADSGAWHQFTTVVAQPGNFLKTGPSDGDIDQPINPTLSWSTSGGATSYEYCIDSNLEESHNGVCDTGWISTGSMTSANLTGLSNATEYEWQVRAKNVNPNPTYANSNTWWTFTTVLAPPGSFTKVSPLHGASDLLPSSVTLQWTESDRATSYWYCVDTSLNATCNGSWVYAGSGTSVLLTDLAFNTTYQWQMRAVNANPTSTNADANTWWTFSTRVGIMPEPFSKQYPLDTAIDIPTNVTLQWTASNYADRYEYCIDTNLSLNHKDFCDGTWVNNGSSRQVTLSGLTLNTVYGWQVRAWNDILGPTYANAQGTYGYFFTFTTVIVDQPGAFGKTTPTTGATNLSPIGLNLTWDASTNADDYEYCVDNILNFNCDSGWVSTTLTNVTLPELVYDDQYEWQVRAFRDYNPNPTFANNGSWWNFRTTVAQPGVFSKSEPVNNAIDRPLSLTLTWGTSTGATSYEYCYEVYDGNSTCEGSWLTAGMNSAGISGLNYATTYSWQVRALNTNPNKTYANAGTWYQFTTLNEPPAAFSKISPADDAIDRPLNLILSWNPSIGATSYAYCIDASINSTCTGTWTATTATSADISGLSYGTDYEWQVRATNPTGTMYANANTVWSFRTIPLPPATFSKSNPVKGGTSQAINLTLTWASSTGATSYQYCIDTTLDSICDGNTWISTGALTSASPAGLTYLTTYQWQVRAMNANPNPTEANSGTWWLFTTMISPPGPFDKISPEDTAFGQPSSMYLSWQPSSGATSYQYCLDPDATPDGICDAGWTATSLLYANAPNLTYGATYEWQVRALNGTGQTYANAGDTPEWWTFIVKTQPANSKSNPNHQAINQPNDLDFTWTNVAGAYEYEYCLDMETVPDGTCENGWTSTGTNTFASVSGLPNGTSNEWQVRAIVQLSPLEYVYANTGETPEWWTFTTVEDSPGDFSKSAPADDATAQPTNDLVLSWATNPDASGYRYCLDTSLNEACDTSWIPVNSGTTSVNVSNLVYGYTYEWQVLASNNNPVMTEANNDETPEWWIFTTTFSPPEPFSKVTPLTDMLNTPIDLTLDWEATVGASRYEYCIDDTLDSICDGDAWTSTLLNTSVDLTGLTHATSYEWQVQAFSTNEYEPTLADAGHWHLLTTVVAAPGAFTKAAPSSGVIDQPTSLMISWNPSERASGYEYCVDLDLLTPGCSGTWVATSQTQAILTGILNNTPYEWQVRAINANPVIIEADSQSWWTFKTIPLFSFTPLIIKPGLPAPVLNQVTVGPGNSYRLSWNTIIGAVKYKIWESTSPSSFPTTPAYETTSTSFTLPTGMNPTRYYYYVAASTAKYTGSKSNTIIVNRQYEFEDNDTRQTANGQVFTGTTYYGQPLDDKDYFKVYLENPGTLAINMPNPPTGWPGQLQLINANTLEVVAWDVVPSNGLNITYASATGGWYYIYIATPPGSYTSQWYAFTVTITY